MIDPLPDQVFFLNIMFLSKIDQKIVTNINIINIKQFHYCLSTQK